MLSCLKCVKILLDCLFFDAENCAKIIKRIFKITGLSCFFLKEFQEKCDLLSRFENFIDDNSTNTKPEIEVF